jgi:hypothetical protein
MSTEPLDPEVAIVQRHVEQLAEHFDTVQILVTRLDWEEDRGSTVNIARGTGNWFARYGQMKTFTIREEERERMACRREEEA